MNANQYQAEAQRTDRIRWGDKNGPDVAILGIIGELGSLASVLKKNTRDKEAYSDYREHFNEELADVLWYIIIIASKHEIFLPSWPTPERFQNKYEGVYFLNTQIFEIGQLRGKLLNLSDSEKKQLELNISNAVRAIGGLARLNNTDLDDVAKFGIYKNLSYWPTSEDIPAPARKYDADCPWYEQLPREFRVDFIPIDNNKALLIQMNGLAIGDRLTDNSYDDDGYRFHDIFHIAGAVTLGWSPVFRRILKVKRKSDRKKDEVEDGARAAIIEEAVINHIYDYARPNFLEGMERVDLDLIKRVQNLVRGYEVEDCEAWEWKDCILKGYRIFRELRQNNGGTLIANAEKRSLALTPLRENLG